MKSVGDTIELQKQDVKVVKCTNCGSLMVNIKQEQVDKGDLLTLKRLGLRLTNPATQDPICINCEIKREDEEHTFKRKVRDFFKDDDDNDSSFFGGGSSGGFGSGGWGGFGGGSFSGGGATGSW